MQTEFLFYINETVALLKDPLQYIIATPRNGKKASWRHLGYSRWGQEGVLAMLKRSGLEPTLEGREMIQSQLPTDQEVKEQEGKLIRQLIAEA